MDKFDACAVNAQRLKEAFLHDVDADTQAFDAMMAAMRLPKSTPEQRKARVHAIREARRQAIETPLGVLERCVETLDCIDIALKRQSKRSFRRRSGIFFGVDLCSGAWMNVLINLQDVERCRAKREVPNGSRVSITDNRSQS